MQDTERTADTYGFLWDKTDANIKCGKWHFDAMQEVINEPIVRGFRGIDVGSGCGYDTYIMAKNNPSVKIVSMDISDGVYKTKEITADLKNVQIMQSSVLNIPLKDNIFDFAYSFGVLHHTVNPQKAFLEISRVLRKNAPAFLYLYEDHAENPIKYIAVKIIAQLRRATVKLNPKVIYFLAYLASPFIFLIFSLPAKILMNFKATQCYAKKIPFNFGKGFFSLRGDLYDRFSTPIEYRFSRKEVYDIFIHCGFSNINITRLNNSAGWIAWGYKNNA